MATLTVRPGDPQALKAIAAAIAFDTKLNVVSVAESKKLSPEDLPAFGNKELTLVLPDGSVIVEPNAMAVYFADASSKANTHVYSVIEWEASVLRPAVYRKNTQAVAQTLTSKASLFDFAAPTASLTDCILIPTLWAASLLGIELPESVRSYLSAGLGLPVFQKALQGRDDSQSGAIVSTDAALCISSLPKLPISGKRNVLITSALPYVNNVPHLGNIIGCVLSADVYARYCRSRGYNTIFICGTDEYGTATETKALEEGLTCAELCDKYYAIHKGVYDWFEISCDHFGRTPSRAQTDIGHEIFKDLLDNGFLEEATMEQLYSEPLGKFLADRYVTGTCPKCGYEDARGDQCDACQNLLNPIELLDPKCKLTGTTPVVKSTKHIFLNLPTLSDALQKYIDDTSSRGQWSSNCLQVTKAWMDGGLKPRCITRDLRWGTPVPLPGYENKVFYVWFDAPIGYLSITAGYCGDGWRAWWRPEEYYSDSESTPPDVELVQFMGKDNVPFHTIIFPATKLGTKRRWTMMRSISVTEYLNYESGKFSKSRGVGVFGNDARETNIPVEIWRYYLLAMRPESSDSAFQWDDFAAKVNADLNDTLGNFVNRTLKFISSKFERRIPGGDPSKDDVGLVRALGTRVHELARKYVGSLESCRLKEGLKTALDIARAGNTFFQDSEMWQVIKTDREKAGLYITACAGIVLVLAATLEPYMPSFSRAVAAQLGCSKVPTLDDASIEGFKYIASLVPAGHALPSTEPTPLFRKIDDQEVSTLRSRFAGNQSQRYEVAPKKPQEKQETRKKEENMAVDISRIDLRVGKITKVWKHPDADSLYVEEIDLGEKNGPRTVVSGLVAWVPEEAMRDRMVVCVCNLKPVSMRGIKSAAMVLAATAADGSAVELVEPPAGARPGDRVAVAGYQGQPDAQLNPKKKVWESVQPDLKTDAEKNASYKGVALTVGEQPCTVASIVGGSIK